MPWKIHERDGKYCVVKETTNETLKCYASRDDALAYQRALYAHSGDKTMAEAEMAKGDVPGHEFRGNQWKSISRAEKKEHEKMAAEHRAKADKTDNAKEREAHQVAAEKHDTAAEKHSAVIHGAGKFSDASKASEAAYAASADIADTKRKTMNSETMTKSPFSFAAPHMRKAQEAGSVPVLNKHGEFLFLAKKHPGRGLAKGESEGHPFRGNQYHTGQADHHKKQAKEARALADKAPAGSTERTRREYEASAHETAQEWHEAAVARNRAGDSRGARSAAAEAGKAGSYAEDLTDSRLNATGKEVRVSN